ncbi:uncharacterized protein CXQ87_003607 [Candidozyma duobushaemuli]|uniref:Hyphally-regulated cell wall protein N-terminal domain-containing protein n=2 Tax=Candidozyma TaxID=3303203 RepID=A0ABX8I6P2_9ASCO|nr:uncharacterized protein CXQ87_003607 [[Candida] duobushaemulonis]PVH15758.1 hypothetical protein CXQ87_003607 [[Candida] duobushaemulonis]QWU88935.1 hypothetical protein CA3LBN_003243 [[Candida] haemuloni]
MRFTNSISWAAVALCASTTSALQVNTDTTSSGDGGTNYISDGLFIEPDVYFLVTSSSSTRIGGDINNKGEFFVESQDGLTASVTLSSGSLDNSGDIIFNGTNSVFGTYYNLEASKDFINSGNIWLQLKDSNIFSPISLTSGNLFSSGTWENTGRIHLIQEQGSPSTVTITANSGEVTNDGTICLENINWSQSVSIEGEGCVNVGDDAVMTLATFGYTTNENQMFYLAASNSSVLVTLDANNEGQRTYTVGGFGNGNKIRTNLGFNDWSYSDDTLSLIGLFELSKINIKIGEGYELSDFRTSSGGSSGTYISYTGAVPAGGPPDKCLCADPPEEPSETSAASSATDPASSEPESSTTSPDDETTSSADNGDDVTTTFETTDSDGNPTTESGVVSTGTDSNGDPTSSTSTFPGDGDDGDDGITTTFETTDSDGNPTTESGVVSTGTDSNGDPTSSTSTFPGDGDDGDDGITTTFETTDSDGNPTTESGVVSTGTDSNGDPTSSTSTFPGDGDDGDDGVTTTFETTDSDGNPTTESGVVSTGTDSNGDPTSSTSTFPGDGDDNDNEATTTFETTDSDGNPTTESGVVSTGTDSNGDPTSSTSLFPGDGDDGATTTFETTDSDGNPTTESGVVSTGTDSDGNPTSSTSLFPGDGDDGATTTFETTDSDGNPTTESGVIKTDTDADGNPTTSTSLFPGDDDGKTTTFETTDADGNPTTQSGIIGVSTDSNGDWQTSTSLLPDENEHTTSWTTTDSDGNPVTTSGVVKETTDADGNLITTTCDLDPTEYTTTVCDTDDAGEVHTKTVYVCDTSDEAGSKSKVTGAIVKTTIHGVVTQYTTYCPPASTHVSEHETVEHGKTRTITKTEIVEVDVWGHKHTSSVAGEPSVVTSSAVAYETKEGGASSAPAASRISTYEGGAGSPFLSLGLAFPLGLLALL